ncbi:MAG: hypothetical protein K2K57_13795 [Oscillospiraceae bacterium]|nr:hypothetical protein [Oscillospiraceae bacterium]
MGIDWESILGCDEDNIAREYEKLVNNTGSQASDCDSDDDELALKEGESHVKIK